MSLWLQPSRPSQKSNFDVNTQYTQPLTEFVHDTTIPAARSPGLDPFLDTFSSSHPLGSAVCFQGMAPETSQASTNQPIYPSAQLDYWLDQTPNFRSSYRHHSDFERPTNAPTTQADHWQEMLPCGHPKNSHPVSNDLTAHSIRPHACSLCSTCSGDLITCGNTQVIFAQMGHHNDPASNGFCDPAHDGNLPPSTMNRSLNSSPSSSQSPFERHSVDVDKSDPLQMNIAAQSSASDGDGSATSPEEGNVADVPYNQLLYRCLLEAPNHELQLKDIYAWFMQNTERGETPDVKGWQNSIRHNLSMNEAFCKGSRMCSSNAKKNVWSLTDEAIRDGIQPTTRFRNHGRRTNRGRTSRSLHPSAHRPVPGTKRGQTSHLPNRNQQLPIDSPKADNSVASRLRSRATTTISALPSSETAGLLGIPEAHLNGIVDTEVYNIPLPSFSAPRPQEPLGMVSDSILDLNQRNFDGTIDPSFMLQPTDQGETMYLVPHICGSAWEPPSNTFQNYSAITSDYYADSSTNHVYRMTTPPISDDSFYLIDVENEESLTPGEARKSELYAVPSISPWSLNG